ncbi:hypothetical protein DVH24_005606 [Malus domestica]|uniref:Uncharacterized protein n=1 Tax=Malus domestica TaxID=3750 RepID=A0A498IQ45_MALDO|nr:hypothetical protein DVH24_005606 [Malus domestica]
MLAASRFEPLTCGLGAVSLPFHFRSQTLLPSAASSSSHVLLTDSFFQIMNFARPFRDLTKRGTVRACNDHGDFAAAKVVGFIYLSVHGILNPGDLYDLYFWRRKNWEEARKVLTKGLEICDVEEVMEDDAGRSKLH